MILNYFRHHECLKYAAPLKTTFKEKGKQLTVYLKSDERVENGI